MDKGTFFDLVVIGAGPAGIRAARLAVRAGAKVAIIESASLGGTCVNLGCIPKKLLVNAASIASALSNAPYYGWRLPEESRFVWSKFVEQKNLYLTKLQSHYFKGLTSAGVRVINGKAEFISSQQLRVAHIDGSQSLINAEHTLLATGGAPSLLSCDGSELAITSDDFFSLPKQPAHCTIVGSGYIAVEFASLLSKLGTEVSLLVRGDGLLKHFDKDLTKRLSARLQADGINIEFNTDVTRISSNHEDLKVTTNRHSITTQCVISAIGRQANTSALNLKNTKVTVDKAGFINTSRSFTTDDPAISAVGDCLKTKALTPSAIAEAEHFISHHFKTRPVTDIAYHTIPSAIFTQPELASVGLTEETATEPIDIYEAEFESLYDAFNPHNPKTYIKVITEQSTGKVVGIHLFSEHASEIIQGFSFALQFGATIKDLKNTKGIHPSIAEELFTLKKRR